jgi:hypothetical protein
VESVVSFKTSENPAVATNDATFGPGSIAFGSANKPFASARMIIMDR